MILSEIRAACYQRLGWDASPEQDITTRVDQFINDTIKEVLSDRQCAKLRRLKDVSFSTVASLPCALPQAATRIHSIIDRTNRRLLDEVPDGWIEARDPSRAFTTTAPVAYAITGYSQPVVRQPAASGQMTVRSTSASDTTQTAYIEVMTEDGYIRTASVTLTGTVAANLGPADTLKVLNFSLSAVGVGEVYLSDASANELSRIGVGKLRARSTVIELYPTPASAFMLYADITVQVTPLTVATDDCVIPEEFQEVIVHGVRLREYQKREKFDLAAGCRADFRKVLAKLQMHCVTLTALDDTSRPGYSQLGPMYPSGS